MKRIGNIEIVADILGVNQFHRYTIIIHTNDGRHSEVILHGFDALCDLEYGISYIKRKIKENEND